MVWTDTSTPLSNQPTGTEDSSSDTETILRISTIAAGATAVIFITTTLVLLVCLIRARKARFGKARQRTSKKRQPKVDIPSYLSIGSGPTSASPYTGICRETVQQREQEYTVPLHQLPESSQDSFSPKVSAIKTDSQLYCIPSDGNNGLEVQYENVSRLSSARFKGLRLKWGLTNSKFFLSYVPDQVCLCFRQFSFTSKPFSHL